MTGAPTGTAPDWRTLNRANWDERVPLHRAVSYGGTRMHPQTEAELGPVAGLRVLHLQCHFGQDSLMLARRGADVTGLDFSLPAIEAARADAAQATSAGEQLAVRFVHADLYDTPTAIPEPASFDRVFTTWGTICWLPDIAGWARVVAHMLRPGGQLYFADMHPIVHVFDEASIGPDGRPGWIFPYFDPTPMHLDDPLDYADPAARLANSRTIQFAHTLADILGALAAAGLHLDWLHERPTIAWRHFPFLVRDPHSHWTWPDRPWFPLSLSLGASKGQAR